MPLLTHTVMKGQVTEDIQKFDDLITSDETGSHFFTFYWNFLGQIFHLFTHVAGNCVLIIIIITIIIRNTYVEPKCYNIISSEFKKYEDKERYISGL